jgi:osomolarity two-component system response regulator SSK1
LELAESLQSAIQNIVDVTPPHLSDVTKDQAASSIPIPAVSISTLLNTMRGLNYLAANFVPICEDQSNGVRIVQDFDLGTLIQSVADQLAPDFARADVELVLLPSGDSGHSASRVLGDRDGISFMLIHVSALEQCRV